MLIVLNVVNEVVVVVFLVGKILFLVIEDCIEKVLFCY